MTDLDEIERTLAEATSAPWRASRVGVLRNHEWIVSNVPNDDGAIMSEADARLIELLRNRGAELVERCRRAEARYIELADALGYVNRADGRSGCEVADLATLLEAARTGVQATFDVEDFHARAEAAEARYVELERAFDALGRSAEGLRSEGAATERAAVVALLRSERLFDYGVGATDYADAVEACAHHKQPPGGGGER